MIMVEYKCTHGELSKDIDALDVDPNSVSYENDQQLRVLKVRTTDKAIA